MAGVATMTKRAKPGKRDMRGKRRAIVDEFAPTPEQVQHGEFNRVVIASQGVSWRRVPVIVTLAEQGKLSERQFNGLCRYRDIGLACDRSPIRDSCDFSVRGNGEGLPPAAHRALIEMGRLERELGALRPIAYAVAIEDVTLSQWAIRQTGSVMRERSVGEKIIRWFEPKRREHKIALVDIRMAGERLAAAIGV